MRSILIAFVMLVAAVAQADDPQALFKQGTAAYQLGKFAQAAELYERAYEMHPDAALLYNAAQANRLAGNRSRALFLYQSYLRQNPRAGNRDEVLRYSEQLKTSLAAQPEKAAASVPAPSIAAPVAIVEAAPAPAKESRRQPKWVWALVATGAVVVVGVAVGLGVGLTRPAQDPAPSYGVFTW